MLSQQEPSPLVLPPPSDPASPPEVDKEAVKIKDTLIYAKFPKKLEDRYAFTHPIYRFHLTTGEQEKLFAIEREGTYSDRLPAIVHQDKLLVIDSEYMKLTMFDLSSGERLELFGAGKTIEPPPLNLIHGLVLDKGSDTFAFYAEGKIYSLDVGNKEVSVLLEDAILGDTADIYQREPLTPGFFSSRGDTLYLFTSEGELTPRPVLHRYSLTKRVVERVEKVHVGNSSHPSQGDFYIISDQRGHPCPLQRPPYVLTLYNIQSESAIEVVRANNRVPFNIRWTPNNRGFIYEIWTVNPMGDCAVEDKFLYHRYYNIDSGENSVVTLSDIQRIFQEQGEPFYQLDDKGELIVNGEVVDTEVSQVLAIQ